MYEPTQPGQPPTQPFIVNPYSQIPPPPPRKPKAKLLILCILLLVVAASVVYLLQPKAISRPITNATPIDTTAVHVSIGLHTRTINGENYEIGLTDGSEQFGNDDRTNAIMADIKKQNTSAMKVSHVTVALVTSLSSSRSDETQSLGVGDDELRGAYLAQLAENADKRLIPVRLLIANVGTNDASTQTTLEVATQIVLFANKNSDGKNLIGVEGLPYSSVTAKALPLFQANKIPVISSNSSSNKFDYESWFHRVVAADDQQQPLIAKFMQDFFHNLKHILIVNDTDSGDYAGPFTASMEASLSPAYQEVDTQNFDHTRLSIDRIIATIKNGGIDAIVFGGFPNQLSILEEDASAEGVVLPPIIGPGALSELDGYKGNYKGVFYATSSFPTVSTPPALVEFQKTYKAKYGGPTQPDGFGYQYGSTYAILEYDALRGFMSAANSLGSAAIDRDNIEANIESLTFDGLMGRIVFTMNLSNPSAQPVYFACLAGTNPAGNMAIDLVALYDSSSKMTSYNKVSDCE